MVRILLLIICLLGSLADCPTTAAAGTTVSDHRPRYKGYKYRGQARKRNARFGFFARWRQHRRYKREHPKHRGVIKVGDLNGKMPSH